MLSLVEGCSLCAEKICHSIGVFPTVAKWFLLYACVMNTEQSENEAADALIDYSFTMVKHYTDHPGDIDAAMVALLARALEKILNKEVSIRGFYL